ncbi:ParM/StbA family protein [Paenibacillus thailandensis]|uniref:ParM/StbA family protein n=1 Tax=Paenibacillus thailandensis TaxID=393250 RepID=A0ABW5R3H2_9BACL
MSSIVAIDAGGSTTKVYDGVQLRQFPSTISYDWRERNMESNGPYDFEWTYNGERGFAGTLAQRESDCADSQKGDTKAHPEALLRVLLALHQFCTAPAPQIIVGQPIKTHTPGEKGAIKQMLQARHDITVNGQRRIIVIQRCEVAAEGVSAGLLVPGGGVVRVLDIGSGTVNFGTLIDRQFNDLGSFTLSKGLETLRAAGPLAFARQIARKAIAGGWKRDDRVYLCGGGAEALLGFLQQYFPAAEVIPDPVTANVRAFYMIARKFYG